MNTRYRWTTGVREGVMVLVALLFLAPVYFLVVSSLKTTQQTATDPWGLPLTPTWENFSNAWDAGGNLGGASLGEALINSAVVTVVSLVLIVALGSTAGYVIARRTGRWSNVMFNFFLIGITLPIQIVVIPLYQFLTNVGLDGILGLVLFYSAVLLPFTVFLYATFMRALPPDYEEAALTEGAGTMTIFLRVVLPLMGPVTGTVLVLNAINIWNDFFSPLVFLGGSKSETLPVVIYGFVGQYAADWGLIFAGMLIAVVPVLVMYLLLQRYVIRGFSGGLKG